MWMCVLSVYKFGIVCLGWAVYHGVLSTSKGQRKRARTPHIKLSEGLPRTAEGFFFDRSTLTSNLLEISEESPSETDDHPSTTPPHVIPAAHINMFKKPQKQTIGCWGVAIGSWWSGRNEKRFLWYLINKSDGGLSSGKTNIYSQMNRGANSLNSCTTFTPSTVGVLFASHTQSSLTSAFCDGIAYKLGLSNNSFHFTREHASFLCKLALF